MIKKFLNVFMCIGLLMQNFLFAIPVLAEETEKEELVINSITQNGKELEIIDGVYQVNSLEQIIVHYTLKNPIATKAYTLETKRLDGTSSGTFSGLIMIIFLKTGMPNLILTMRHQKLLTIFIVAKKKIKNY